MIKEISEEDVNSSEYQAGMYPKGCEHCIKKEKITFYITFKCDYNCFYCSVPAEFKNTEQMMVGNVPVKDMDDAFDRIRKYKCVAISGGEPLLFPDKVLEIIERAKELGLYTYLFTDGSNKGRLTPELLNKLIAAGLDEIKMSAKLNSEGEIMFDPYQIAKCSTIPIHAEFPMFPDMVDEVYDFAVKLDQVGVSHLLLDQIEYTTGNADALTRRGYEHDGGVIKGSKEAALQVVERALANGLKIRILYCGSQNQKHRYKYV